LLRRSSAICTALRAAPLSSWSPGEIWGDILGGFREVSAPLRSWSPRGRGRARVRVRVRVRVGVRARVRARVRVRVRIRVRVGVRVTRDEQVDAVALTL
jgi:hypothetical protein